MRYIFFDEVAFLCFVPLLLFSLEIKSSKFLGYKSLMFLEIIEPRRNKNLRNYTFNEIKKVSKIKHKQNFDFI